MFINRGTNESIVLALQKSVLSYRELVSMQNSCDKHNIKKLSICIVIVKDPIPDNLSARNPNLQFKFAYR